MGRLKWQVTYQLTLDHHRVPECLAISQLGDFCVVGGHQFVGIWTLDSLADSYSINLLYAKEASGDKNEVIEECSELEGTITQALICGSGRMFGTLESRSKSLKIWFNSDNSLKRPPANEVNFRRFHTDGAPIEPYELPKHKSLLQNFRFLASYNGIHEATPSVLLTLTQRKAFVWVESFASESMAFNCIKSFDIYYDAMFLEQ